MSLNNTYINKQLALDGGERGERSDSGSGSFTICIHRTGERLGPSDDLKTVKKRPPQLEVVQKEF